MRRNFKYFPLTPRGWIMHCVKLLQSSYFTFKWCNWDTVTNFRNLFALRKHQKPKAEAGRSEVPHPKASCQHSRDTSFVFNLTEWGFRLRQQNVLLVQSVAACTLPGLRIWSSLLYSLLRPVKIPNKFHLILNYVWKMCIHYWSALTLCHYETALSIETVYQLPRARDTLCCTLCLHRQRAPWPTLSSTQKTMNYITFDRIISKYPNVTNFKMSQNRSVIRTIANSGQRSDS
jgi:hypothetical protein